MYQHLGIDRVFAAGSGRRAHADGADQGGERVRERERERERDRESGVCERERVCVCVCVCVFV